MLNLSITNINPYKQQSEGLDGYLKSGSSTNGAVNLNAGEKVVSQKSYDNSLTFANIKASQGVKILLGDYNISLSKNGVLYSNNIILTKNAFDVNSLNAGAYLRIEVLGDKLTVGIRNNGSEAQLYNSVIEAMLNGKTTASTIAFESVNGSTTIYNAYSVSLDSTITIDTEIYNAELENLNNKIVVKPEKQQGASDATLYIVIGSVCTVAIAGTVVCILLVRRKRRAK